MYDEIDIEVEADRYEEEQAVWNEIYAEEIFERQNVLAQLYDELEIR